uniref:Nadh:ubiquinone oxidoreductase 13 kDa subunit n=1 Tax=Tetraselmis sp. GSL018 TaxID=582737 RepID=A0A061QQ83_9CHLO|eukprot:CAMPEP_0177613774 /NCGR_PEP_ID=MMETSP0419_2-20121207/22221_1 /TAXON_ID=582737 /ORGANISM="Tetraselmis sp., Strain GSL018" /LENGTH=142 /DNA_ID=CAMNT_0019110627 /DNA_START=105 /DNA_END=533 /DNA_ORIENTATION=+
MSTLSVCRKVLKSPGWLGFARCLTEKRPFSSELSRVNDLGPTTKRDGELRSTSGVGLGDGYLSHTDKWLQAKDPPMKTPQECIDEAEPIAVSATRVASYGHEDTTLGCPVEYIDLRDTSYERPAVCKYTGNKYYWDGTPDHH